MIIFIELLISKKLDGGNMVGIFIVITCSFNFVSATILGDKDVYIDIGSSLKLTCNVRQVDSRALYPNDPHFIIWKRNNEVK